jgi:hypothetical protein
MKKILIASVVGAVILFAWQALSWMVTPFHLHTFRHTPAQDSIIAVLNNSGLTTGVYQLPSVDNTNVSGFDADYHKKSEELMNASVGHPAATIFYVGSVHAMHAAPMLKGFLYDLIALFCACMLLSLAYQSDASFFMRWWMVMLIAIIYVMQGPMMGHNWMWQPWHYTKGFIWDAFIGWGLAGLWLAKYLGKVRV